METRSLGSLNVSALGLGCMGMTYAYGPADEAEALRVLRRYVERGGNFLDTAECARPVRERRTARPVFARGAAREDCGRDQVRLSNRARRALPASMGRRKMRAAYATPV